MHCSPIIPLYFIILFSFIPYSIGITCSDGNCNNEEYDFIVVGSGAAGATLAERLSRNGAFSVIILEAGPDPIAYRKLIDNADDWWKVASHPDIDWGFKTIPQPQLDGRVLDYQQAKVGGGCNNHNALMWNVGNRADYDSWAEDYGCEGWSWDHIKDIFFEFNDTINPTLVEPSLYYPLFEEAAKEVGLYLNEDYNNGNNLGFSRLKLNIDEKGQRKSSFSHILEPALNSRDNIKIIYDAIVTRVILDNENNVEGVEYSLGGDKENLLVMKAGKEVILSAGAIKTPQILLLSGIGPAIQLSSIGVDVKVDSPRVGRNFQDHVMTFNMVSTKKSMPESEPGRWTEWQSFYSMDGQSSGKADIQFITSGRKQYVAGFPPLPGSSPREDGERYYFMVSNVLLHPKSRGHIRLSSSDPFEQPIIHPNFLSDQRDIDLLLASALKIKELLKQPVLEDLVDTFLLPPAHDFATLEAITKATLAHVWHPAGTCRMGAESDPEAVVDTHLRVKGVNGLRIADASVFPHLTSGNTQIPTMIVGANAANIIISDNW